jgi:hypothetical protein
MGWLEREERQIVTEGIGNEVGSECGSAKKTWFCGAQAHFEEGVAETTPGERE